MYKKKSFLRLSYQPITQHCTGDTKPNREKHNHKPKDNKCSAVAEMGDCLATTDISKKLGAVPLWGDELGPHATQCGLGRGLPPYQVASGSIQPFGNNRHGPKIGGCAPLGEGTGSPSNTMWPGLRPTRMPSFILIRPTIWPQYTNVADRQTDRQTDRQNRTDNGPMA